MIRRVVAALAVAGVVTCGGGPRKDDTIVGGGSGEVAPAVPLYTRLGGKPAIARIVDALVPIVLTDVRISAFLANTKALAFEAALVEQICAMTGGNCAGADLKRAHAGMGLRREHVDALVEDLGRALDAAGVAAAEKTELLERVSALAGDLVEP